MNGDLTRIVLIGSGNVAEALARSIPKSGMELVQVYARNAVRAREVAALAGAEWASEPERLVDADLYLIAVSDRAVAEVAASLPIPPDAVVAHTAGSVALDALPAKFARRGVFYPLQTFTRGREVDFSQVPLFLECSDESLYPRLEAFARRLSRTVVRADSARRAQVHLAGVFACNFANHMYALGERIVAEAGLDFEVLKPLVRETADKALDTSTPCAAQTGPAQRNDAVTLRRHAGMLAGEPLTEKIYETISQSIWETSRKI